MAGEIWVGGGGCVRSSSKAAQLQSSKKTTANRRVSWENRKQSFPEKQRQDAVSLTVVIMIQSSPRALAENCGPSPLLEISRSFFLCYLPRPWELCFSILVPKPALSLHCILLLLPDAQSQDRWPIPPQGYSLNPTTLAQYLRVEEFGLESIEQKQENIHNYFKVNWGFCSQPLDNSKLEEKWGKLDVSKYGWRLLAVTQYKDRMPGQG